MRAPTGTRVEGPNASPGVLRCHRGKRLKQRQDHQRFHRVVSGHFPVNFFSLFTTPQEARDSGGPAPNARIIGYCAKSFAALAREFPSWVSFERAHRRQVIVWPIHGRSRGCSEATCPDHRFARQIRSQLSHISICRDSVFPRTSNTPRWTSTSIARVPFSLS